MIQPSACQQQADTHPALWDELWPSKLHHSVGHDPLGDPTLLRQVWYNLVDNAIKYSRQKPVSIITISAAEIEGGVTYSVEDNGVGFDMAYYSKLFGVFQRLQRVEDFEGTGIGLALVRRIVERHHGSVSAKGTVGEGATFSFTLPVTKVEEEKIA